MIDRNTLLALRMERMHITAPAGSEEYDELFAIFLPFPRQDGLSQALRRRFPGMLHLTTSVGMPRDAALEGSARDGSADGSLMWTSGIGSCLPVCIKSQSIALPLHRTKCWSY